PTPTATPIVGPGSAWECSWASPLPQQPQCRTRLCLGMFVGKPTPTANPIVGPGSAWEYSWASPLPQQTQCRTRLSLGMFVGKPTPTANPLPQQAYSCPCLSESLWGRLPLWATTPINGSGFSYGRQYRRL